MAFIKNGDLEQVTLIKIGDEESIYDKKAEKKLEKEKKESDLEEKSKS